MIRQATADDLNDIYRVESECFPQNEAATKKELKERLTYYPNHFWLIFKDKKLIAFADGFTTDSEDLDDEMYKDASLHDENGSWQMIFGLNTLPEYRNRGYATMLIEHIINTAEKEKRSGVVLTCKKDMISYYSKFGFADEGISKSKHGGESWNQMRLRFHG